MTDMPPTAMPQTWRGLSESEAAVQLQTKGYNELPSVKPRSLLAIAREVAREPMFLLLAVVLYGLSRGNWLQGFLAGILMITGDYASTAQNIARQVGLPEVERVLSCLLHSSLTHS